MWALSPDTRVISHVLMSKLCQFIMNRMTFWAAFGRDLHQSGDLFLYMSWLYWKVVFILVYFYDVPQLSSFKAIHPFFSFSTNKVCPLTVGINQTCPFKHGAYNPAWHLLQSQFTSISIKPLLLWSGKNLAVVFPSWYSCDNMIYCDLELGNLTEF